MNARPALRHKRLLAGGLTAALAAAAVLLWQPAAIEWHCYRARRFASAFQDQRALGELQKALKLTQARGDVYLLLARVERRLGNLDHVRVLLQRAEAMGSDPAQVEREAWLLSAQEGNLAEAEPFLRHLLMDPRGDGRDIYRAYAAGYLAEYRLQEARALLDAGEREYPEDPELYFLRGRLMMILEERPEAAAAFRKGLKFAPDRTAIRCRLADLLIGLGAVNEAGEHLRQCLAEAPQDRDVLLTWAGWLFTRGDASGACDVLQRLLAKVPNQFEALRLLGQIEFAQGRPEEALPYLQSAVRLRPYNLNCRYMLGRALRALGRTAEAKPHLDYVAEAGPHLLGLLDKKRQLLTRPRDIELRYQIGSTLLKYGAPEAGVRWLTMVLQLQPDHQGARRALAAFYEGRGQRHEAQTPRQPRPGD